MDEITCAIPGPILKNTVIVLKGYATRLEGAIDVLSTIPAGRRLVEPHAKLLAAVRRLETFYSGLEESSTA